jgi:ABC-type sugar transport system ATPase subunit
MPADSTTNVDRDDRDAGVNASVAALRFSKVTKNFGNFTALLELDLAIASGSMHALVGENGAGKSTCLGTAAGRIAPSSGEITVYGEPLEPGSPRAARAMGVVSIYQELTIVPALSAQANVYIGQPLAKAGFLSEGEMRRRYVALCKRFAVHPQFGPAAGRLSVADQQVLEIMRGLVTQPKVMLLDEPTASLGQPERDALFRILNELRASGMTIVLVSHNLGEVLENCDTASVFRDGRLVETRATSDWTRREMVRAMIGEEKELADFMENKPASHTQVSESAPILAKVEHLTVPGLVSDISFEVREGEILGLGGLVGSGRTTVLRALAGLEPKATGTVAIRGRTHRIPRSVRAALRIGIALVPEDRKMQGLALKMSAGDNVVMSQYSTVSTGSWIRTPLLRKKAEEATKPFAFAANRIDTLAGNLSGGNQQKLLLARWFHRPPQLLLADEPTRGVDIGAKRQLLDSLSQWARDGQAIVVVSSELEEVVAIAHRVTVLAAGRQVATLDDPQRITVASILERAFDVPEES